MQNQANRRGRIHFAELETGGLRAQCPQCHVPFTLHLGHLVASRVPCKNCKANLSYRSSSGSTVRCPCCSSRRPLPSIKSLVCGRCNTTIIYQKDERSVKCYPCKHITYLHEANDGVSRFYQYVPLQAHRDGPPEEDWVISQKVNRVVSPQTNQVVAPQVNRAVPPQTHLLFPHQVNRIVPPETNRVVPPQTLPLFPHQANRVVPPETNRAVPHQVNRVVPPQTYSLFPQQVNQAIPPETNRVVPHQVNRVVPPQTYSLFPHQVNRVVHPQINRVVLPQVNRVIPPHVNRWYRKANAETESTATSPFTPNTESESTSAFIAAYVARIVREYCTPGIRGNKREVDEEDKTEPKNKKPRL